MVRKLEKLTQPIFNGHCGESGGTGHCSSDAATQTPAKKRYVGHCSSDGEATEPERFKSSKMSRFLKKFLPNPFGK